MVLTWKKPDFRAGFAHVSGFEKSECHFCDILPTPLDIGRGLPSIPLSSRQPVSVHPEMVGCGSDQGRSEVETAGVAALRRGFQPSENAELGHKMPFMDGHQLSAFIPLENPEQQPGQNNRPQADVEITDGIIFPGLHESGGRHGKDHRSSNGQPNPAGEADFRPYQPGRRLILVYYTRDDNRSHDKRRYDQYFLKSKHNLPYVVPYR
jgi:hypothetical protein